jgi:hypothetical protein
MRHNADPVIAVTLGFLTSPSPFQIASFDRPSELIAMLPLSLIPVFAVPLSILLHMASLQRLRQDQVTGYRAGGTGGLFFDVLDRELVEHIFDELTHHAQLMVTVAGPQALLAFAVKTASPRSVACLDHVEHGNVPRVAGECISALNPVMGHQQASCGKSLEDLGQCFMGQSVEFGQVTGAERTLAGVFCQVLRSEETVTRSPS